MLEFKAVECLLSAYVSCDTTVCANTQTFHINTVSYGRIPATLKDGTLTIKLGNDEMVRKTTLDGLYDWLKANAPAFD